MDKKETLEKLKADIRLAVEQFGTYVFGDKGAGEVCDISGMIVELKKLPTEDIMGILKELVEFKIKKFTAGEYVVREIVYQLQDDTLYDDLSLIDDEFMGEHL